MLTAVIEWSLRNRWLVILLFAAVAGLGGVSLYHLPIDAFPDTTPVQVQINAGAPALSAAEIEQQITMPIEWAVAGLPRLSSVRSVSKFGLSQVTVTFDDGTDVFFARQVVNERLATVELPAGISRPELGPVSTGLGEVFHYVVTGTGPSLAELTTIHDWVIRPQLLSVPGVAEVNTWGGRKRQFQVDVDPARLIKHELTLDEVIDALQHNNQNVGGGNVVRSGEMHLVQGVSLTTTPEEIASIVVAARDGVPICIRDVADVHEGHEIPRGAATLNAQGEVVLGLAFMLMGENSADVTGRLAERLDEVRKTLPPGVEVRPVYQRRELVDQVIATVRRNLAEGALLVVAILFIFLGQLRAGLIVAAAIPLSMLLSFSAMLRFGISASLLSLGAIDFGLVVDSSVIMVESAVRRLGESGGCGDRVQIVRDAALEVRKPTMFGELIIMVVYLPILLLEGVEGRLFRPMALTVIFALAGSMLLSLTLMPVLASLLLPRRTHAGENVLVRAAQWVYRPLIRYAVAQPWPVIVMAGLLLALGVSQAIRLGSAFLPRLYEQSVVINTIRLAGVSLDESVRVGGAIERLLLDRFPDELRDVWTRTGTAAVATDPMGIEVSDVFITLKPRESWKRAATQAQLTDEMARALEGLPGMRAVFTQPIELRMNEMVAGVRADLGVKIFGDDLAALKERAADLHKILAAIPGSADVSTEQLTGQPTLEIRLDQAAAARYGVHAAHILQYVEALGGVKVGEIREDQRRFDLTVRLPDEFRRDTSAVRAILIPTADGQRVPLTTLASVREIEGPATINREWQKRRIVVQCNVRGRDLGSFVQEARRRVAAELSLPPGYFVQYGGQFEHLQRAATRLAIVVPAALTAIIVLLYLSIGSLRDALIVFTGAPFAALGGVAALTWLKMPFTISAGVGFVAVCGVSMLNGLVLVSTIRQRIAAGVPLRAAIEQTRLLRMRPILMTALVASLGFIPMAVNSGVGAEIQRPLATVVIAGVVSDNLLTLMVLPALYSALGAKAAKSDALHRASPADALCPHTGEPA